MLWLKYFFSNEHTKSNFKRELDQKFTRIGVKCNFVVPPSNFMCWLLTLRKWILSESEKWNESHGTLPCMMKFMTFPHCSAKWRSLGDARESEMRCENKNWKNCAIAICINLRTISRSNNFRSIFTFEHSSRSEKSVECELAANVEISENHPTFFTLTSCFVIQEFFCFWCDVWFHQLYFSGSSKCCFLFFR